MASNDAKIAELEDINTELSTKVILQSGMLRYQTEQLKSLESSVIQLREVADRYSKLNTSLIEEKASLEAKVQMNASLASDNTNLKNSVASLTRKLTESEAANKELVIELKALESRLNDAVRQQSAASTIQVASAASSALLPKPKRSAKTEKTSSKPSKAGPAIVPAATATPAVPASKDAVFKSTSVPSSIDVLPADPAVVEVSPLSVAKTAPEFPNRKISAAFLSLLIAALVAVILVAAVTESRDRHIWTDVVQCVLGRNVESNISMCPTDLGGIGLFAMNPASATARI